LARIVTFYGIIISMAGPKESKAGIPFDIKEPRFISNRGRLARVRLGDVTVVYDPRHNSLKTETQTPNEQGKSQ
jgi:hypothetical protein